MLSLLLTLLLTPTAPSTAQAASAVRKADLIVVYKGSKKMLLMSEGYPIRQYGISLGPNPEGHKQFEGDGRTPEGYYTISQKNKQSRFHLALRISYPNKFDKKYAKDHGRNPGGDIMIHGLDEEHSWVGAGHRLYNWTDGCIGVTNEEIEDIWSLVDVGTGIFVWP